MKKILSLSPPLITTWTWHANLLSILENYPESKPWILSNYIQISSTTQLNQELFFDFWPSSDIFFQCPFVYNQILKRETAEFFNTSIIDFLTKCIDMNNYIFGIFDEYYISTCESFNKRKHPHELFIFGYDRNLQAFEIADFTLKGANSRYSHGRASFKEIEAAYRAISISDDYLNRGRGGIHLISFFHDITYSFDTELVIDTLKDYINSNNTARLHANKENPRDANYGISAYESLRKHLILLIEGKAKVNYKPFHFLVDHKTMMLHRIKFMGELGIIKKSEEIYNDYFYIQRDFTIIRNQYIKAGMQNDGASFSKMINKIDLLVEKEVRVLMALIENITSVTSPRVAANDWLFRTNMNRARRK
ncbi:hypothetical protein SAMN02799630_05920 [Paenibacillus sp. UNCCL117]|uniref:hypothetical protein n=1 Tax=unclassified Paenibacillus TaxID=185978 RepID=UPI0008864F39|nr:MULTISPECIES: hypothetical protein [unclassified Paenibacillus]SDE61386.1 hypothetical protein SAMN04488602_1361 [Paenibacillus sp. cl123]SFW69741.1 hypothetical protein SAMN02799630_05920 [Paenibacillus sp. UNCCL117]